MVETILKHLTISDRYSLLEKHIWFETVHNFYITIVTQYVPGPLSISYFIPFVLLPTALLIPVSVLSHSKLIYFFLPPIYAGLIHAWICMQGVDVISVNALLWSTYLLAFCDPRRDFKRVRKDNSKKSSHRDELFKIEVPYPTTFISRLAWIGELLASTRLHGWTISSSSHDLRQRNLPPPPNRVDFVLELIPSLLLSIFLLILTTHLHSDLNGQTSTLISNIIPPLILRSLTLGLYTYALLTLSFTFPAPLLTFTNYLISLPPTPWSPHSLPPYFGPFSHVLDTGVAGLWGRWWHQHMRVLVSAPGSVLADICGCARNSSTRYALIVASGFFWSGVTHAGLIPRHPSGTTDVWTLRVLVAGFFWVQAVGVGIEVCTTALARRLLSSSASRTLENNATSSSLLKLLLRTIRLLWTVLWMCATLTLLEIPFAELHYWSLWPPPFLPASLTRFLTGSWIP